MEPRYLGGHEIFYTSITGPSSSDFFGGDWRREKVTRVLPVPVKMFSVTDTTLMMKAPRNADQNVSTVNCSPHSPISQPTP